METLRSKREQKKRERFTGREEEISLFIALVKEEKAAHNILSLWGLGGVGKSTLIRRMKEEVSRLGAKIASADLHESRTPIELMITWRSQLDDADFQEFDKMLDRFKSIQSKIKVTLGSLSKGAAYGLMQSNPIGAFAVGAIGEERIRAKLNSLLPKPDVDFYLSGINNLTKSFTNGLNTLAQKKKLVFTLDTYENASQELDNWLRSFMEGLSSRVLVAIAGRDKLEEMNPDWTEWMPILCEREIGKFSEGESVQYLQKCGVTDPQLVKDIRDFTGDLPWALELTVETLRNAPGIKSGFSKSARFREVERKVVSRFIRQISQDKDLERLVETCAILEHFDEDVLGFLLGPDKVTQTLKSLRKFSFVKTRDDGQLMLNDTVREFIEAEFQSRAQMRWKKTHGKVADYYEKLLEQVPKYDALWQKYNLDWLYHAVIVDQEKTMQTFVCECNELLGAGLSEYCGSMIEVLRKRINDPKGRTWLDYYRGQVDFNLARWIPAMHAMKKIVDSKAGPVPLRLGAYSILCDIFHRKAELRNALQMALEGLELAKESASPEFIALLGARAAEMYGSEARLQESRNYCSISEDSLSLVTQPYLAGPVHILLSDMYLFRGDLVSGERNLIMALQQWENAKNGFGIARTKISLSWLYMQTGKWELGLKACKEAHGFFNQHADLYHVGLNTLNMAEIYRLQGRTELSIDCNLRAITTLKKVGSKLYEAIATYQLGCDFLDETEYEKAIEKFQSALKLEVEDYHIGLILLFLALTYERAGKPDQTDMYFKQSEAMLSKSQNKYGLAVLHLEHCRRAILTGNNDLFLSSLAKAKEISDEWNYIDLLARISRLKGECELHQYVTHSSEEQGRNILEVVAREFETSLRLALSYNRYLLDETMRTIGKVIIQYTGTSCPTDGNFLLNQIKNWWASGRLDSGQLLTASEAGNRNLEIGNGEPQMPLLKQIEALQASLQEGDHNAT